LLQDWLADPELPVFRPERCDAEMTYFALGCACQGDVFRLSGQPRVASGAGGPLRRAITRVWREAREPMEAGEPVESPYLLPLVLQCDRCGRSANLFETLEGERSTPVADPSLPKESHRCRVCRRGLFDLVAGMTLDFSEAGAAASGHAVELVARCHACHRQARVAWADARPSAQQIRLDRLYGRR
jgi:hypothetical protein